MCCYRFVCSLLLIVVVSRADGDGRTSAINHHQPSAVSDGSFTPLSLYGGSLFPADVSSDEQVFAPTLPLPEKQVFELASLRVGDTEATSASSHTGGRSQTQADVEHHPAAQKIYPTFFRNIPPLGHSRPYYQSTEAAVDQRFNKLRTGAAGPAPVLADVASPLLGSGDFGIIKGGTFYYDSDVPGKGFVDDFYGLGYNGNNGHGRPQLAYLVQKPQKEEQFSNFRDFADINISNDPAYSHHAPQYIGTSTPPAVSAGSTTSTAPHEPENILDELRSLDERPRVRSKLKKDALVERKKRPKDVKSAKVTTQAPEGDDYMVASS
ncbi:uncharacterized protein LOC128729086 [Anopheles nili]|uniref:uncharacterized protein LOC128729086 n=1 Tax=Anopheles nili TaxID=185578 RepID=UPI00237A8381|nr:uncharacterized protein LOC128729086 [Anopheles nili]